MAPFARPAWGAGILLAAAPLYAASIFYLLDLAKLTQVVPAIGWAALLGLAPAIAAWRRSGPRAFEGIAWVIATILIALFAFQLRGAFGLPAHDHLTPLAVARAIAGQGTALHQPYSEGASLVAYPPGLGVLLAPFFISLGDLGAIGAFKFLAAATLGLMPIAWAFALKRLYLPEAPLWPLVVAMAIGFFLLDRNLMNASIYAGKNSFFTAAMLFPVALVLLVEGVGDWRRETLAVLACLGVVLVHFSAAYMLTCFLAAWLALERPAAGTWFRLAAVGGVVLALFVPLALLADRSAMTLTTDGSPVSPGRFLANLVIEKYNLVLFVYHDHDKLRVQPWPWKGAALIGCVALLAGLASLTARMKSSVALYLAPLARAGATFLMAVAVGAVLGSGLIPKSGVERVYTAWYLIFFMAPIFALTVLGLWALTKLNPRTPALLLPCSLVLILGVGAGGLAFVDDYLKARRYVLRHAPSRADLTAFRDLLGTAQTQGPCYLIMQGDVLESKIMPDIVQIAHGYRPFDHATLLSDCRVMTGTFTTLPFKGGRELDGYPSAELLATLPSDAALLFIGSGTSLGRYLAKMPRLKAQPLDQPIGLHDVVALRRPGT